MRLKRLKLHNYCQHAGTNEWLITGNTIGITGRNGRGKTNFVRAVQDAATGDFHKKKERIPTHGATTSFLEADFDVMDGTRLRVWRDVVKNDARLEVLDESGNVVELVANTISGVNEALTRYIPVDPNVLKHIVFTKQEEITKLLFGGTAAKERMAQSFFGVERAKQIEKSLGEILSSLPAYDDTIAGMLEDVGAQLTDLQARELEIEARVFEGLLPEEEAVVFRETLTSYATQASNAERRQRLRQRLVTIDRDIIILEGKLAEERDSIEGFSTEEIQGRIDQARADTAVNTRIDGLSATIQSWRTTIEQSQKRDYLKDEMDELVQQQVRVAQRIGQLVPAIKSSEGVVWELECGREADCPVCRHKVMPSEIDTYLVRLEGDRAALADAYKEDAKLREQSQTLSVSLQGLHADASAAEARIADAEAELQTLGEKRKIPAIQPLLDAIRLIEDGRRQVAQLESSINMKKAERGPVAQECAEVDTTDREDISAEQYHQAQSALLQHENAVRLEAATSRDLAGIRGQIGTLQRQQDRLAASYAQQQGMRTRREKISRIRAIFHYSGAPQAVVRSRLLSVQSRINHYLELLNTPYRVSVGEGLSFMCNFPGKDISSEELSGGEKVDLCIAFRLASCESFCSNVGFVVLDEPTTWLDAETKHEMVNVLERLNELGRSNNFQFIIPTHERGLLEHFDQVIELT